MPEGMQTHLAELANMSDDLMYLMMVSFLEGKDQLQTISKYRGVSTEPVHLFMSYGHDASELQHPFNPWFFRGTCHPCSGRAPRSLSLEVKRSSVASLDSFGGW